MLHHHFLSPGIAASPCGMFPPSACASTPSVCPLLLLLRVIWCQDCQHPPSSSARPIIARPNSLLYPFLHAIRAVTRPNERLPACLQNISQVLTGVGSQNPLTTGHLRIQGLHRTVRPPSPCLRVMRCQQQLGRPAQCRAMNVCLLLSLGILLSAASHVTAARHTHSILVTRSKHHTIHPMTGSRVVRLGGHPYSMSLSYLQPLQPAPHYFV